MIIGGNLRAHQCGTAHVSALGARPFTIVRKVGLPRAMPYYFASLKIAITSSFLGSTLAEIVADERGIGHLMVVTSSRFEALKPLFDCSATYKP
jgi:ABC-type nitrate/sulfonate/bicarbonate transport system permease component